MTKTDWVRCPNCKHKLFKVYDTDGMKIRLEIKCHSCKEIIEIIAGLGEEKLFQEMQKNS